NPTTADSTTSDGTGTGTFTSSITGLTANTTYHVRAYATNSVDTSYGSDESFATDTMPTVTTTAISNITATTATGGGNVTSDRGDPVTARGVCWSTFPSPTTADNITIDGSGTGPFTSSITGLTANTTYHVRAYATNSVGTAYGSDESFTSDTTPTVTTTAISNITSTTATGGGNVTADGGDPVTARGVCWSTAPNPTTADNITTDGSGTGPFTSSITGLSPGTTYHIRAYATNAVGTSYGSDVSFTTDSSPTVATTTISNITPTAATGNGKITDLGVPNPTSHGMVWNDTGVPPTLADSFTDEGAVGATGAFTSDMTGLTPSTTYYVRAYATNTAGTSYGNKVIFTTTGGLPKVSTTLATDITDTTAVSGGKVSDDGGSAVTAHGVCWSTSSRPTVRDDHTVDGSGTGWFTSYLTELIPDTTYYYRAYATNSFGTAYGREKEFTTKSLPEPPTVEILDPEDGANVSGVVTITAKANSEQGIKNVEFYVDGNKIGEGIIARTDTNTLSFDLTGSSALFIDSHNYLKKRDVNGNTAEVLNSDIETQFVCIGPDGHIYTLFKSPQKLADGSYHSLVKVNPCDGHITGIDPHNSALFTGFKTSPVLQFDGAGHLYYFAAQGSNKLSLRRFGDKAKDRFLFACDDMEIAEWLVQTDGAVILAGRTKTTGSRWLKILAANQAPVYLTELFSDIEWISDSADGYAYAGTTTGVYRVSGRQAVEIPPNSLPADAGEKENELEESFEVHGLPGIGDTYSIDWDTSLYDFGLHTIKAVAFDNMDQTGEDSVSVNIPEIILTLTASKETEKAWIISRLYGKLEILVENLSNIPVSKYLIYRNVVDGEFKVINTFTDADLIDGAYSYNDKYLENDKTYTYKVEAVDADERVIAQSVEVTI
ncbi:Ig-like domain-containing protein, partial [Acidobacteriota bacterium]